MTSQKTKTRAAEIPDSYFGTRRGTHNRRRLNDAMADKVRELIGRYFAVAERPGDFFIVEDDKIFGITSDDNARGYVFTGEVFTNSNVRYNGDYLKTKLGIAALDYIVARPERSIEMEFVDHANHIAGFSWRRIR